MDTHGLTRLSSPKSSTSNRFLLRNYPHFSPPPPSDSSADADLTEDDIFAIDSSESNDLHHRHGVHHHHHNNFSDSFGILAALPKPSSHSHLYHKSSISSSSSRTIPSLLKPTEDRSLALGKYYQHQSAPVKVPTLTSAMKKSRHWEEDVDEYVVGGKMLVPPHEIVERRHSPVVACSVVEGAGRTLKGRDLRQVRNAVWRRTGKGKAVMSQTSDEPKCDNTPIEEEDDFLDDLPEDATSAWDPSFQPLDTADFTFDN